MTHSHTSYSTPLAQNYPAIAQELPCGIQEQAQPQTPPQTPLLSQPHSPLISPNSSGRDQFFTPPNTPAAAVN